MASTPQHKRAEGGEKNTLSHSTVWDVRTRPKSVQYKKKKKKKEEQKLVQNKLTERPMTFIFSDKCAGWNSKEKVILRNKSNFKVLLLFF